MKLREHRQCGDDNVVAGRGVGQRAWYQWAGQFVLGKSVLDVGCGLGYGLPVLAESAKSVEGQDLDPRLETAQVSIRPLSSFRSKSYDFLTSIDVIEHVENDSAFVQELVRIAQDGFFVTTPNWTASRCQWPYHIREYTPRQLYALLEPYGEVTLFKGSPCGSTVYPVKHRHFFNFANDMRSWLPTSFFTRCLNFVLPTSSRINSHLAALVRLR